MIAHVRGVLGLGLLVFACLSQAAPVPGAETITLTPKAAVAESTTDHSKLEALKGPFKTGPEVTKACLSCHMKAAHQVMGTIHWTWDAINPRTGREVGKRHVANSFCGSPFSNEPRCTSCHVGYGWVDNHFDFTNQNNVDCLACHDTTDTYRKIATDAGHPLYQPREIPEGSGHIMQPPDLARIAQQVGKSRRENCGACHFNGGGGDGVKHGDLDSSLDHPNRALDVHMGVDGENMVCADCHTFNSHQPSGSRYIATSKDTHGIDLPRDDHNRATCESCHGVAPHEDAKLNHHVNKVACQTCHIPEFARGGIPTKMSWDWSTGGRMGPDGKPLFIENERGYLTYSAEKGDFIYGENVRPEYKWYNGIVNQILMTDKIDDTKILELNPVGGSAADPNARIWPFKVMHGRQPYDKVNKTLAVNHVFGQDDSAFWEHFNFDKSIKAGMDYAGYPYSGEYGFIETRMNWFITHMVAPKEKAVPCEECHTRASDGRLAAITDIYLPGRDRNAIVDFLGWLLVTGAVIGSLIHGVARLASRRQGGVTHE